MLDFIGHKILPKDLKWWTCPNFSFSFRYVILWYCFLPLNSFVKNRAGRPGVLCNFIETTLWHQCSPVSLLHIFRTYFPKNTYGRLLLEKSDSLCTFFKKDINGWVSLTSFTIFNSFLFTAAWTHMTDVYLIN